MRILLRRDEKGRRYFEGIPETEEEKANFEAAKVFSEQYMSRLMKRGMRPKELSDRDLYFQNESKRYQAESWIQNYVSKGIHKIEQSLKINKGGQSMNTNMIIPMELKDTAGLMQSVDYKQRFFAEYWQTRIRYEKLKAFCNGIEAAEKTQFEGRKAVMPEHDCPLGLLKEQQHFMGEYLHILEIRAVIEHINLSEFPVVPVDGGVGA